MQQPLLVRKGDLLERSDESQRRDQGPNTPFSSICDTLEAASAGWVDKVALQVSQETGTVGYTYAQTFRLARNLSRSLRQKGIEKGDSVAIWAPSGPKWAIAYLATLFSGAVVVPLDTAATESQVRSVLLETGCKLIVTVGSKVAVLRKMQDAVPALSSIVVLDRDSQADGAVSVDALWQESDSPSMQVSIAPDDVATIVYTSGTTGIPKGVIITHESVATVIAGVLRYLEVSQTDNVLAVLPSHHVFAPIGGLFAPLAVGATVTYMQGVSSPELLRTLQTAGITVFPCVPDVFYLLHKRIFAEVRRKPLLVRVVFKSLLRISRWARERMGLNLGRSFFGKIHQAFGGHLRLLISGGAYFDPKVIRDFHGLGFIVQQGYGLTEGFGGGTFTPVNRYVPGSVGIPLPGLQTRIVEPDASGAGEIAIAGPSLMRGYLNDPELTSQVLRDGWLYTGDLGYQDDAGNLYVTGRRKEMIVLSSGKKVSPEELEKHYLESPCISEVCVLGVKAGSDYAGTEALHAIVVPDFEYVKSQKLASMGEAIRDDIESLSARLQSYQRILTYEIRADPLPRTATRKVMRWILQDEFNARPSGAGVWQGKKYRFLEGDDRLLESETSKRVLEVLARGSTLDSALHLDMNLELDLGFDSMQRIELVANLEQLLEHRFDDSVNQCLTVRDLLKEVARGVHDGQPRGGEGPSTKRVTWQEILESPMHDEMAENYILKPRPFATVTNFIGLKLIYVLAKMLFRLEVRGIENLPRERPYLICPNHQSYLDGILMCSVLPYRVFKHLFSLGWAPFFTGGLKGVLARLINTVPISANSNVLQAMQISAVGLRAKKILLVFPEGGLSLDGKPQPFRPGAAILARKLQVPVVPVAIKGSYSIWSKGGDRIRLAPVKIQIGRPMDLGTSAHEPDELGEEWAEDVKRMEREVNDLLAVL